MLCSRLSILTCLSMGSLISMFTRGTSERPDERTWTGRRQNYPGRRNQAERWHVSIVDYRGMEGICWLAWGRVCLCVLARVCAWVSACMFV